MTTELTFTIPGEPVSKARARFTSYGSKTRAYTPEKTLTAEANVGWAFKQAGGTFEPDREVTFGVRMTFHNGTRQRRDVDNMIKLILDGLNGVAWVDDTQVMEVAARKTFTTRAEAHTDVVVYVVGQMDRLTSICEECGAEFVTYASWRSKKHCSDDCRLAKRRKARLRTCIHCGTTWDAKKSPDAKYCSRDCAANHRRTSVSCAVCGSAFDVFRSWARDRNYCSDDCRKVRDAQVHRERRARVFPGSCAICGTGTTRKEYRRCNPCKLAGKVVPA